MKREFVFKSTEMSDKQHELVQRYINTHEYLTIKIHDCYLLFHRNIVQHSPNRELGLELPPAIVKRIFGVHPLSVVDVTSTCHVDPSLYDIIIFADKSALYTRTKPPPNNSRKWKETKLRQKLPYYVQEDLELLRCCGMSEADIDQFVRKLQDNRSFNVFAASEHDQVLQKIIDASDMPTRLNCRLVCRKWRTFVDRSPAWNRVFLTSRIRHADRALAYFQKIDIRELDLSQSKFEPMNGDIPTQLSLSSLRSLCIATDHPPALLTLLCRTAPLLQYIKLVQTVNSSLKLSSNQLCDCVNFVICLCQNNVGCLRRLHVQLRSASDQVFLESSATTSIPISYEIIPA